MTTLRKFVRNNATLQMKQYEKALKLPNFISDATVCAFREIQGPRFNYDDASSFVLLTCWIRDFLEISTRPGIAKLLNHEALFVIHNFQSGAISVPKYSLASPQLPINEKRR